MILFLLLLVCMYVFDFFKTTPIDLYRIFYFICSLGLISVAALSYKVGSDEFGYRKLFDQYPTLMDFKISRIDQYRMEPAWVIFNVICKTFTNDFTFVHAIIAIFLNSTVSYFIWKVSKFRFATLFAYYILLWITTSFESLRQSLSFSFYLWGCLSLLRGSGKGFLLRAFPMILFHKTGIIVYLLTFFFRGIRRVNKKVLTAVVVLFSISVLSNTFFSGILNVLNVITSEETSELYTQYMQSKEYGIGVSKSIVGSVLIISFNIIVPLMLCRMKPNVNTRIVPLVLIFVFFSIFQFSFLIFGRLMQYNMIFYIIAFTNVVLPVLKKHKMTIPTLFVSIVFTLQLGMEIAGYFRTDRPFVVDGADVRYFPYKSVLSENPEYPKRETRFVPMWSTIYKR